MVLSNLSAKLENKALKLEYEMVLLKHKVLSESLKNITACCTSSEEHKKHLETMEIAQLEAKVSFQL